MDFRDRRTSSQFPKPPLKRKDRVRRVARSFFAAGLGILLLLVVYLSFYPVPADQPGAESPQTIDLRADCEYRTGARSLEPAVHAVSPGGSIQSVLDHAQPGDTVVIPAGVYHESLRVQADATLLLGLTEGGQRPVLDGMDRLEHGIVACANGITLDGIDVRGFIENGVLLQDVDRATVRSMHASQVGQHGILVLHSQHVTVANSAASGAGLYGIAISQSRDVTAHGNETENHMAGIAVVASSDVLLEANHAHDNSVGVMIAVLPELESKQTSGIQVRANRVVENNRAPAASDQPIDLRLPPGIGVLIAADHAEVSGNEIRGNQTAGVAVLGLRQLLPDREGFDVGTLPEGNWIHGNTFENNGNAPAPEAEFGADLIWDLSGWDNLWSEPGATRHPMLLPSPAWPDFVRRGLWRALTIASQLEARP